MADLVDALVDWSERHKEDFRAQGITVDSPPAFQYKGGRRARLVLERDRRIMQVYVWSRGDLEMALADLSWDSPRIVYHDLRSGGDPVPLIEEAYSEMFGSVPGRG